MARSHIEVVHAVNLTDVLLDSWIEAYFLDAHSICIASRSANDLREGLFEAP